MKRGDSEYEEDFDNEEEEEEEEEEEAEEEEDESDEDEDEEESESDDDDLVDPLVLKVKSVTEDKWALMRLPNETKYSVFVCLVAEKAGVEPNIQVEVAYIPEGKKAEVPVRNKADLEKACDAYFNGTKDFLRVVCRPTELAMATLNRTAAQSLAQSKVDRTTAANSVTGGTLNGVMALNSDEFSLEAQQHRNDTIRDLLEDGANVKWTEMRVLGSGAFGKVVEALTSNGRLIAVKHLVIAPDAPACMATTSTAAEEIISEIKLLKQLRHRHIVEYYGCQTYEEEDGTRILDIFLEHCHGGSINSLRKKFDKRERRLSVALARNYTRQILEGLQYLHDQGVVHRDIKGDNVLIAGNGDAKLADFGCSKKIGTGHMPGAEGGDAKCQTLVGTPLFMAPEVMKEEAGGYDRSADIWSIGCLVIELFGRQAWIVQGNSLFAVMYAVASSKTLPTGMPEECDDALREFLTMCFQRDPKARPQVRDLLSSRWMTMPEAELTEPQWKGAAPVPPPTPAAGSRR